MRKMISVTMVELFLGLLVATTLGFAYGAFFITCRIDPIFGKEAKELRAKVDEVKTEYHNIAVELGIKRMKGELPQPKKGGTDPKKVGP